MAMTGGTAKLVKTGYKGGDTSLPIKLYVYYKTAQDVANNKSTITLGMYFTQSGGSIGSWTDGAGSYVGTTANTFSGSIPNTSATTYWLVENKTMTVNHNADGTGSATIYWKWGVNSSWGGMAKPSGSFSITLPTIPRKSTVSATTANVGATSKITITRSSSNFTHTLTYTFGTLSGTIATKTTATSVNFAIPTSFYAQIGATATSKTGTIKCETFNGTTSLGSKTCNFTVTTSKANDAPTLNPIAEIATDSTSYALTGSTTKFIKGYTNVTVATGSAARNGATISSNKIESGGRTIWAESGTFYQIDSPKITYYATDSRGYTTTQTLTRDLVEYVKLTTNLKVNATVDGTATLKIDGNYFNDTFGAVNNTLTVQARYRIAGGTWGSWTTITATKSGNTYSATHNFTGLDYREKYGFEVKAVDKLKTVTSPEVTAIALPVFDWGENDFNFNVPITIENNPLFDYVIEHGWVNDWYYRKWYRGRCECYKIAALTTPVNTAWGTMYCGNNALARQDYPITFVQRPIEYATLQSSGNGWAAWLFAESSGNGINTTTQSAKYNVCRPTGTTTSLTFYINLYVMGKWK